MFAMPGCPGTPDSEAGSIERRRPGSQGSLESDTPRKDRYKSQPCNHRLVNPSQSKQTVCSSTNAALKEMRGYNEMMCIPVNPGLVSIIPVVVIPWGKAGNVQSPVNSALVGLVCSERVKQLLSCRPSHLKFRECKGECFCASGTGESFSWMSISF